MISLFLALLETEEDRSKLEKIYNEYKDFMKSIAMKITNNSYYADVAVSDTLLKLSDKIKEIRTNNKAELKSFIFTVTQNASKNVLREKNKTDALLEWDERKLSDEDIEDALSADEQYKRILKIVYEQPEIYRDVLSLYYVHGCSLNDIANLLDRNYNTVKSQLARGTVNLQYILKTNGYYEKN